MDTCFDRGGTSDIFFCKWRDSFLTYEQNRRKIIPILVVQLWIGRSSHLSHGFVHLVVHVHVHKCSCSCTCSCSRSWGWSCRLLENILFSCFMWRIEPQKTKHLHLHRTVACFNHSIKSGFSSMIGTRQEGEGNDNHAVLIPSQRSLVGIKMSTHHHVRLDQSLGARSWRSQRDRLDDLRIKNKKKFVACLVMPLSASMMFAACTFYAFRACSTALLSKG